MAKPRLKRLSFGERQGIGVMGRELYAYLYGFRREQSARESSASSKNTARGSRSATAFFRKKSCHHTDNLL